MESLWCGNSWLFAVLQLQPHLLKWDENLGEIRDQSQPGRRLLEVFWILMEVGIWEDLEFLASGASVLGIWEHLGFPSFNPKNGCSFCPPRAPLVHTSAPCTAWPEAPWDTLTKCLSQSKLKSRFRPQDYTIKLKVFRGNFKLNLVSDILVQAVPLSYIYRVYSCFVMKWNLFMLFLNVTLSWISYN